MNDKKHPTTDLNRIIELAAKWQDKFYWTEGHKMFAGFQEHRDKASADWIVASKIAAEGRESEQLELFRNGARCHEELSEFYHSQVIDAHREFLELKNLVRQHCSTLLHFVPDGNFVADEPNADITQQLRDLKQLEGQVRAMLAEGPPAVKIVPVLNPWKQAREQNRKITVSDQMQTLFIKDESIVDRKNLSSEVATILCCSPQAVRHPGNVAWKFYLTEQARRKKIREESKGKRWTDSEQNDADD